MYDLDLRPWSRLAALVVGVLLLVALYAELASAQALQALPYSATNISLSTGSPTVTVPLNALTFPDRPQLKFYAIPDSSHRNMTLEIAVDQCPQFGFPQCFTLEEGTPIQPWNSNSEPGAVEWVAPVWQCIPAPLDENTTGIHPPEIPQCRVQVTATNFGSGGSPATFDLHIVGQTKPVTDTAEAVVNTSSGAGGDITTDRVHFITDSAQFRWIYDDDQPDDNTVETFLPLSQNQLGICAAEPGFEGNVTPNFPYTYSYVGSPSYVGFDCCTWRTDSPSTGTTGSGQVLLKVNLAPGALPPDSDGDGFYDPCDNCKNVPNGPFIGTCVTPSGITDGTFCFSDLECGPTEFCSMAQEDNNFSPDKGLVCLPEPGATALLASGVLCLIGLDRRRRKARVTASC